MGFFERFKGAREAQQQQKIEKPGVKTGEEAEMRGQKLRAEAGDTFKKTMEGAWKRISGLGKMLKEGASSIKRGTVSALDRAIGTPGLIVDISKAGKQAAGETIKAGVKSADEGAARGFTRFGEGAGKFILDVGSAFTETKKGIGDAFKRDAASIENAIVVGLQKHLSSERFAKLENDSIMALANALAEQGVDATTAKGAEIITKIGKGWERGVGAVSDGLSKVDTRMNALATSAENRVTTAKDKLVNRARSAINAFNGWRNKSRIQEARISKLEEENAELKKQNAEIIATTERQNALLEELLAGLQSAKLSRKTGEPLSVKESASA